MERKKLLLIVFFTALIFRLVYFFLFSTTGIFGDGHRYIQIAEMLFNGREVDNMVLLTWSPGYSIFLWGFISFLGKNILAIKFAQHILGAVTAVLVFILGEKAFNKEVGFVSGILWAIYGYSVLFSDMILSGTLFILLLTLLLIILLKYENTLSYKNSIITGIMLGIIILVRHAMQGFLVLLPLLLYFRKRINAKKALIIVLIALIVTVPNVLFVNDHVDKFIFLNNTGEWLFHRYNNIDTMQSGSSELSPESLAIEREIMRGENLESGYILGLEGIISNPVKYVTDSWDRFTHFIWLETYSLGGGMRKVYGEKSETSLYWLYGYYSIIFYVIIVLLAIPAFVYSNPKNKFLLLSVISYFVLLHTLLHAEQRHHLHIMPIPIIFSAYTILNHKKILNEIINKPDRKLAIMLLIFGVILAAWLTGFYQFIILDV